jgi:hypothetical protein
VTPTRTRDTDLDEVCASAVDLARAAAFEEGGEGSVGDHLEVASDGERVVTHYFAALLPGYVGWRWAVTVTRASRAKDVTVDEAVLLPGDGALLAPAWVPWQERLRPGDLGVGDVLPTAADDDRLVPAYAATMLVDSEEQLSDTEPVFGWEYGRARVLSRIGRDDATDRWYVGVPGPEAPIAKAAPGRCATCGFWLHLSGSLGNVFGACANEYAPDDGRVVSADHGCGAHSEAVVVGGEATLLPVPYDDDTVEVVPVEPSAETTEELGHS